MPYSLEGTLTEFGRACLLEEVHAFVLLRKREKGKDWITELDILLPLDLPGGIPCNAQLINIPKTKWSQWFTFRWGFRMNTLSDLHSMSDRPLVMHDTDPLGGCTNPKAWQHPGLIGLLESIVMFSVFMSWDSDTPNQRLRPDVCCISSAL